VLTETDRLVRKTTFSCLLERIPILVVYAGNFFVSIQDHTRSLSSHIYIKIWWGCDPQVSGLHIEGFSVVSFLSDLSDQNTTTLRINDSEYMKYRSNDNCMWTRNLRNTFRKRKRM